MNASWFANVIASANETLTDRRLFFRHAAGLLIFGAGPQTRVLVSRRLHGSSERSVQRRRSLRGPRRTCRRLGAGHRTHGASFSGNAVAGWRGLSLAWRGYAGGGISLACISLAFITVTILALDAAFERLGVAPLARFGAIGFALPASTQHLSRDEEFRHWEGALAAAGIAVCLAARSQDGWRPTAAKLARSWHAGVRGERLEFVQRGGRLVCYGIIGWLALRRRGWLGFIAMTAFQQSCYPRFRIPWALRNEAVFGEKVWTRTAFG